MKRKKTKFRKVLLLLAVFIPLLISGCSGDDTEEESKSMAQIQQEEGIPIKVKTVEKQDFEKYLNFFAKLTGINQTTQGARIGGRVKKINVKEGEKVKKGDIIIKFPTDAPAAQFEQAKAAYENSKKNYERLKELLKAGETSQSKFDGAETKYLVDKRNYETQKQLIYLESPYDGTITEIMVKEKESVKAKAPLFTVAKLNKMTTDIYVNEEEEDNIETGMKAIIEQNDKSFEGVVTNKSMSVDPMRQAFAVEVEFDNPNYSLKANLTYQIKILTYKDKEAVVVPRSIIHKDKDGNYVFVKDNSQAKKKYITRGKENGLYVEVKEGLAPGDKLITKGSAMLEDGQKVKVIQ